MMIGQTTLLWGKLISVSWIFHIASGRVEPKNMTSGVHCGLYKDVPGNETLDEKGTHSIVT